TLQVGTYDTARFADLGHAGLDVFGDGRTCNQSSGTLTIGSITFNAQGQVTGLKAKLQQHCENGVPGLYGPIRYYQGRNGVGRAARATDRSKGARICCRVAVGPRKIVSDCDACQ